MAGPPRPNPEAGAVPFLCGAHDRPNSPHPSKTCLDHAMSGLEALVPLCELIVVGLQALFKLAVCPAEQQSARDGAAHLGIERRKPRRARRGAFLIHNGALSESRQGAPFMCTAEPACCPPAAKTGADVCGR